MVAAPESPRPPLFFMMLQIHQYYGTFGFSLAIVTEKTYKQF
jgi:hypothetical protein